MDEDVESLPNAVLNSRNLNRDQYKQRDQIAAKCAKFVHGEQWDPEIEEQRANAGLDSIVADRTMEVFKTLDGFVRTNRNDVKFIPLGDKNYKRAEFLNGAYVGVTSATDFHNYLMEAVNNASIVDDGYLYIYPQRNALGQMWPSFYVPGSFEIYCDCNAKDPITRSDAQFYDFERYMVKAEVVKLLKGVADQEFMQLINDYQTSDPNNQETNSKSLTSPGSEQYEVDGQLLVLMRFFKRTEEYQVLIDLETKEERQATEDELINPDAAEAMGFKIETREKEMLWYLIMVPAPAPSKFAIFEQAEFQPIDPRTLKKQWPIIHVPWLVVMGKSVGAIKLIIKLQEARNTLISSLLHAVRTNANGALMYDKQLFNGLEDEEQAFKTNRNRAGESIGYNGKDGINPQNSIFPVPSTGAAFNQGGPTLEQIFSDVVTGQTGAKPVLAGDANKGAPASLFAQQTQNASNSLTGTSEIIRRVQEHCAEIIYCFMRQYFRGEYILELNGIDGSPDQLIINEESIDGILNDVSKGLYAVRKTVGAANPTARRQQLADSLDVIQALANVGLPPFVQDFTKAIMSLEQEPDQKQRVLANVQQWQASQGIQSQVVANANVAQAQASMAMSQNVAGQPGAPGNPPGQPAPVNNQAPMNQAQPAMEPMPV